MKHAFTILEALIAIVIVGLVVAVIFPTIKVTPAKKNDDSQHSIEANPVALTKVPYYNGNFDNGFLVTLEHDGHKFIVHTAHQKSALVHHPSCQCGKW